MRPTAQSSSFILEAFDRELWCPVLQTRVDIPDPASLRAILGKPSEDDPDLQYVYWLDAQQRAAFVTRFEVSFLVDQLDAKEVDIRLFRRRSVSDIPYLIHTGYELPLLLDGRKKLARMSDAYPPATFDGEDRFEHWVAQGVLHRDEVVEPFDDPGKRYLGLRTVYYTAKGEEWRIPAMRLIWDAAEKSGGWNEHFERLEGMLFGYEDWQNDWWINQGTQRGGFGGLCLCCAVTANGLAWIEAAGFRALPPIDNPSLSVATYDHGADDDLRAFMLGEPDSAALVRFNVRWSDVKSLAGDFQPPGPRRISRERIPELNKVLRGSVEIVARREGNGSSSRG